MRRALFALVVGLVLLVGGAARAAELVAEGEVLAGWALVRTETHPEYVRFFFAAGEATTGVEVAHWTGEPDDWTVEGQRVMPAPGEEPPRRLLEAVLSRVKARQGALDLKSVARRPRGAPPTTAWPFVLAVLAGFGLFLVRRRPTLAERVRRHLTRFGLGYLALLLLGAAAMRVGGLGRPFEADESTQRIFFSSLSLPEIVAHDYADQRHPPLFYLLLKAARLFGDTEAIARLPAVTASLVAIGTAFAWVRHGLGTGRALAAAAVLAASGPFLVQSRAVADVTTFLALTSLAGLCGLRALAAPGDVRRMVAWVVSAAALLACYYMAPLVLVGHAAAAWPHRRHRHVRRAALAIALLALPTAHTLVRLVRDDGAIRQLAERYPGQVWGRTGAAELLEGLGQQLAPTVPALAVLAVLSAGGLVVLARERRELAWMIGPTLVATLAVLAAGVAYVRFKPYYGLFLLPYVLVAASAGLAARRPAVAGLWTAGLAFVVGSQLDGLRLRTVPELREAPSYRFDQLGAEVRSLRGPSRVIALANPLHTLLVYYGAPRPTALYRHCQRPTDGYGTRCRHEGFEVTTLVALPELEEGWEEASVERLRQSLATPAWVVDVDTLTSASFRAYLARHCRVHSSHGPREGLRLHRCPAAR